MPGNAARRLGPRQCAGGLLMHVA